MNGMTVGNVEEYDVRVGLQVGFTPKLGGGLEASKVMKTIVSHRGSLVPNWKFVEEEFHWETGKLLAER